MKTSASRRAQSALAPVWPCRLIGKETPEVLQDRIHYNQFVLALESAPVEEGEGSDTYPSGDGIRGAWTDRPIGCFFIFDIENFDEYGNPVAKGGA